MLDVAPLPLMVSQAIWGDSGISARKRLEKITDSLGTPRLDPLRSVWKKQRTLHAQSKAEGFLLPHFQSDPLQELHFPTTGLHHPWAQGGKSHLCPAGNRMQCWWGPGDVDSSPDSSLRTLRVPALPSSCHHCPAPPTAEFC